MAKAKAKTAKAEAKISMPAKAPVEVDSLFIRINSALKKRGEQLRTTRRGRARVELGTYYVTNATGVVAAHVDLETLAREVGALAGWETLVADKK